MKTVKSMGTFTLEVKVCAGGKGDLKIAACAGGPAIIAINSKDASKTRVSFFINFLLGKHNDSLESQWVTTIMPRA
jgi:hypothetical protein